jgi:predicted dithiol-disulfide oxidoreductase (DUF899 family)
LLAAEEDLKERRERVAALRRELPTGRRIETDYVFREGPSDLNDDDPAHILDTPLSALFAPGKDRLIIQHLMFEPDWEEGCPMCSMWADGLNGIVPHLEQRVNVALIAKAEIGRLRAFARRRGWHNMRLLSSFANKFNEDFGVEQEGRPLPAISVLCRESDGAIHHFYTSEGSLVFRHHRAMDLFTPVWNLFDLLPEGRGGWMPETSYD